MKVYVLTGHVYNSIKGIYSTLDAANDAALELLMKFAVNLVLYECELDMHEYPGKFINTWEYDSKGQPIMYMPSSYKEG